jgi:hypothetical protein
MAFVFSGDGAKNCLPSTNSHYGGKFAAGAFRDLFLRFTK